MAAYPKWLYHPTKAPALVQDEAAHKALGAGWVESPADVKTAALIATGLAPQSPDELAANEEIFRNAKAAAPVKPVSFPKKVK